MSLVDGLLGALGLKLGTLVAGLFFLAAAYLLFQVGIWVGRWGEQERNHKARLAELARQRAIRQADWERDRRLGLLDPEATGLAPAGDNGTRARHRYEDLREETQRIVPADLRDTEPHIVRRHGSSSRDWR